MQDCSDLVIPSAVRVLEKHPATAGIEATLNKQDWVQEQQDRWPTRPTTTVGRFHHWIYLDQRRAAASYMAVEIMEAKRQPQEATMLRVFHHTTILTYLYSVLDCNLSAIQRRPYTVCCRFKAKNGQFGAKSGPFHQW